MKSVFFVAILCLSFLATVMGGCLPTTTVHTKTIPNTLNKRQTRTIPYVDCRKRGGTLSSTKQGCLGYTTFCVITATKTPPTKTTTTTSTTNPVTTDSVTISLPTKKVTTSTTTTTTISFPPKDTTTTSVKITSTKCVPKTITVTEKEKVTVTEQETVTVTVKGDVTPDTDDSECSGKWAQCGGINYNGPKCCKSGLTCRAVSDYYSQCV